MTKEEAQNLKRFDHLCSCGGYAWMLSGRDESDPHMVWCLQRKQYAEWWAALHQGTEK